MNEPHIVVLSGSGISAESGLKTFRDNGGLWESHSVYDVATPEAFARDPEMVQRFYNMRRAQLKEVEPNAAHAALARLEDHFKVSIVTQNVDDLHEKADSKNVLHLHGELTKVRSSINPTQIFDWGYDPIQMGQLAPDGSQLRPHVVWFGEPVPAIVEAEHICQKADHLLVVGSSLQVYPAAGLIHAISPETTVTLVDPGELDEFQSSRTHHIKATAASALPELIDKWIDKGYV